MNLGPSGLEYECHLIGDLSLETKKSKHLLRLLSRDSGVQFELKKQMIDGGDAFCSFA